MTLVVEIGHRFADFTLDAGFEAPGGLIALFGPSGSGKTSVVNAVAGLLRPDRGRLIVGGRVLMDSGTGLFLPRHKRRIGYVFQDGRLFPHLTVRQNLLYGQRFLPRGEAVPALGPVVEMLGIGHLLDRYPLRLSGGEKSRVAIGRALLAAPLLLLMDEPFAALDEARKAEILPYVERLRDETAIPILYVSHHPAEVARLADKVVLMDHGRVADSGPPARLFSRIDLPELTQRGDAGAVIVTRIESHDPAMGLTRLKTGGGVLYVPLLDRKPGALLRLRIQARDVLIARGPLPDMSALNILPGKIAEIGVPAGHEVDLLLDCGGDRIMARITRSSLERLGLSPGNAVYAIVKSVAFDRWTV